MADTHRPEEDTREYFDAPDVLAAKIELLVELIRGSRHLYVCVTVRMLPHAGVPLASLFYAWLYSITLTGAGISTACGIPDYRSGMGTVLATGPGAWELKAHDAERPATSKTTSILKVSADCIRSQ